MDSLFQIIAALGSGIGVATALLIWRARKKPTAPKPVCCGGALPPEAELPCRTIMQRLLQAIDYLRTRREWRYQSPWILLLGQKGAGKSSLLASLPPEYKHPAQGRQNDLLIDGCDWQFINNGALIDPVGGWPVSAANGDNSKDAKAWERVLDHLNALRPERALDGLLLIVSADTLQHAGAEDRQSLAENLRQQLRTIQERFEFALPVYVVVTDSDSIEGFSAFWRTQPIRRRNEIFGWSAPTQSDNGLPGDWANAAFEAIGDQLKVLQVDAAANCARIEHADVDQFFLFPRHFQQLQAPFSRWIETVFQPLAWQAGFFCRGIYFTGHVAATGNITPPQEAARGDISFVTDLVLKKVLAEPRLGRPTRQGVWSRNHLLRSLQIGGIVALGCLLTGLSVSIWLVDSRVDAVIASLKQMQALEQAPAADSEINCIRQEPVFQTLEQIARINADTGHVWIPVSLLDHRLSRKSARSIADSAMKNVVIPGIACQLRQRAKDMSDAPSGEAGSETSYSQTLASLFNTIAQIDELERNRIRFDNLSGNPPYAKGQMSLSDFIALVEYAYRNPLPAVIKLSPGVLPAVLAASNYNAALALPANFKQSTGASIARQAQQVHSLLGQEIGQGARLLSKLEQLQEPLLNNTREFGQWLSWVRKSWLGSTNENNPYQQIHNDLGSKLAPLIQQYGYSDPALPLASKQFGSNAEYQSAMAALGNLQLASYGPLFTNQNGVLDLNPKLNTELAGINALIALDFMQINDPQPFVCQSKISVWNDAQVTMASNYAQEYDRFARNRGLVPLNSDSDPAARPLYDRLARHQLELVMNNSLNLAQTPSAASASLKQAGLDFTSPADVRAAQESAQFNKLLQPILNVQKAYQDKQFSSANNVAQCVRNFAADSLGRIQLLADQSQLYQPIPNTASDKNRDANFFDLGNAAVIKDMLAQQVARVQILVGYATPYLNYLNNSDAPPATSQRPNTEAGPYWNNTINELNRYVQAKDTTRQVGLIENLFTKQLPDMNGNNCGKTLDDNEPAEYGNDLFSLHRQQLEQQIELRCESSRSSQALTAYNNWAARFNHDLAGHYPFGSLDGSDDADLITTENYFTDYAAAAATLRQSLNGLDDTYWDKARTFLDQLDAVVKFFNGNLIATNNTALPGAGEIAAVGAASPPPIKLNVQFRAQAADSPGSDQIVNWNLASGNQSSGLPNRPTSLNWAYGQSLLLGLEWANSSQLRPVADGQNDLKTEGSVATFDAKGNWALLRLLDRHKPGTGSNTDPLDAKRRLLQFNVAVNSSATPGSKPLQVAKLYLSIGMTDTKNPTVLKLPATFPTRAPQ